MPILRRLLAVAVLAVLAASTSPGFAQSIKSEPYVWRNVKVVAGGFIPGTVFSPVEKGLAYLRSDMGGCYRWDDQKKTWIPLNDALAESSYHGGESIAPDPVDPNVVYIAAGMYRQDPSAILRSRDRGNTWEVFPVTFRMGGNEDGRGMGERLAIDPNQTAILYFGSRHDGLQRSSNAGESWSKMEAFPIKGRGLPGPWPAPTNGGLSFVVFDPSSGQKGSPTKTIFVGSSDAGDHHLFRSNDAGETWKPIPGEPKKELLPVKAQLDQDGTLYVTYCNGIGPNGVTDGAVMKLDTKTDQWTDITPDKRPDHPKGGYMGLALDRQHPGTLAVATMNRWQPIDTVWRSTDAGQTWHDIAGKSERDVSLSPFLFWGDKQPKLGWWMAALAIDPFDSNHAVYATGATVYATNDFGNVNKDQTTHWQVWGEGIEQTAIIRLCSPTSGPHLLSAFGDIGGFAHDDLSVSPPQGMYMNPRFTTTVTIDYAGAKGDVIVRSGHPSKQGDASLAYSDDAGHSWQPIESPPDDAPPPTAGRRRREGPPAIIVSADGSTFMVMTHRPVLTRDRGKSWTKVTGLPEGGRPVADRVDPSRFYSLDFNTGKMFVSTDAGATFAAVNTTGLPSDIKPDRPTWSEAPWPLCATPDKANDLWFVSKSGLYHSPDGGKSFEKSAGGLAVEYLGFGKSPAGKDYPALFATGTKDKLKAVWRSDDAGASWIRVNDDQHQWGTRFRCITGDPRVFGRVYVGTDGRGILYGDVRNPNDQTPMTNQ
jgi:xyloglucan-specific exo-beta-1,4-glucanase